MSGRVKTVVEGVTIPQREAFRMKPLLTAAFLTASSLALAADSSWTTERICGAGLYNYFFLKKPPVYVGKIWRVACLQECFWGHLRLPTQGQRGGIPVEE